VHLSVASRIVPAAEREPDLLALDQAIEALAALDPDQSRIVELRYFGGLTIDETAEAMGVSPATVKREWATARLWLKREIRKGASAEA
jgi:RNA polymerase sigma factor (sigma-70 family)